MTDWEEAVIRELRDIDRSLALLVFAVCMCAIALSCGLL